jgi:hypothetical protein
MKKKMLSLLFILFTAIGIHQCYWYYKYGGNFIVWVDNFSDKKIIDEVEIYLDGKKILKENITRFNKPNILKLSIGKHILEVKSKPLGISNKYEFSTYFIQRGVLEFYFNIEEENINVNFHTENVISSMVFH